jgi:hypothetical protein
MRNVLALLVVLSFAAGCASMEREGLLAAGYHPQYVDGYVDGYTTGCHTIGHPFCQSVRDATRFEQDQQYKKGWEAGYCIARMDYAAVR